MTGYQSKKKAAQDKLNSMEREALKLALEALENSVDLVREDAYNAEKLYGNYPSRQGKIGGLKVLADDHEKAITAIKAALAQPEQETMGKLQEPTGERAWFTIAELNAWADKKLLENPQWVMPKDEPQIAFNSEVVGYVAPQRTWVGLTDEEVKAMDAGNTSNSSFYAGALWAEAKLKEKNA
jgi:hypothetical protein